MLFLSKRQMNARQAAQKAKDAQMDFFAVRFSIRQGDKHAAAMVNDYAKRYSAWHSNIQALREYLAVQS